MSSYKLYFWIANLLIILTVSNSDKLNAQEDNNSHWTKWRGQNYGSVELDSCPTEWKTNDNIAWKISLKGEGHSSPVSDGKFVYITSSSKNESYQKIDNTLAFVNIALVFILIIYVFNKIGLKIRNNSFYIKPYILSISILIAILFILILGNGYFNYSRCNLRAWFVSVVLYTLFFVLYFIFLRIRQVKAKQHIVVTIVAFSILLFYLMPNKSHAFRGGIFHMATLTTISAFVIPFFILFYLYYRSRLSEGKKNLKMNKTWIPLALFIIGVMIVFIFTPVDSSISIKYNTFISFEYSVLLVVITLGLFIIYKKTIKAKLFQITNIIILSNLFVYSVLEKIFLKIEYFQYHMGNQEIVFMSNDFKFQNEYLLIFASLFILGYLVNKLKRIAQITSIVPLLIIISFLFQNLLFENDNIYDRNVLCYDIDTGKEIWKNSALKDVKYDLHDQSNFAASTPVLINNSIISYFGNSGLICINKITGKTTWKNEELNFKSYYGAASSPVYHNDRVYILHGNKENQLISSINCNNGKVIWQNKIEAGEIVYRQPLITKIGNKNSIVCISKTTICIYNLDDGNMISFKEFDDIGGDPVSSIVPDFENINILYVSGQTYTIAIDLNRINDEDYILWRNKFLGANCSSPIIYKDFLYTISDNGWLSCIKKSNGEVFSKRKLSGIFYSSLCRAGKFLYATNLEGKTFIFDISENKLIQKFVNIIDEKIYASMAFVKNMLIIRTSLSLMLINPFQKRNSSK